MKPRSREWERTKRKEYEREHADEINAKRRARYQRKKPQATSFAVKHARTESPRRTADEMEILRSLLKDDYV